MRHINLTINNLFCKNIFTKSKDSKDVFNKTNKIIIFIDKIYDEFYKNRTCTHWKTLESGKTGFVIMRKKKLSAKGAKTVGTDEIDKNLTKSGREKKKVGLFVQKIFQNEQFAEAQKGK